MTLLADARTLLEVLGGTATDAALTEALCREGALAQTPSPSSLLDVPPVIQAEGYSCGRAALMSVLCHLNVEPPASDWATLGTDAHAGTSPADIAAFVVAHGLPLAARAGLTLEDLADAQAQGLSVLCCVQMHGGGHWVVVRGVTPSTVALMDPAIGLVEVGREDFESHWHDVAADGREYVRYGITIGTGEKGPILPHGGR